VRKQAEGNSADVNALDNEGRTPLDVAVQHSDGRRVNAMIQTLHTNGGKSSKEDPEVIEVACAT